MLTLASTAGAVEIGDDQQLRLEIDLRLVTSDAPVSYINGGLGKLRFDDEHGGIRLGQITLGYRAAMSDSWSFAVDLAHYGDDASDLDLLEAWFQWRQVPRSAWRSQVKVGAFYAPISLENRLPGWRSPFSLSSSAINTWVGEELRTIGAEYSIDWLGQKVGRSFELGGVLGVYAWNDPAGVIIAQRGWGIHDRQTALFGKIDERVIFKEIDGRPGYYAGAEARIADRLELRALHYDNFGDRVSYSAAVDDFAWDTIFDSVGAVWTPNPRWTVIAQAMDGVTYADPFILLRWDFDSAFVLASYAAGPHRITVRVETFDMQQVTGAPDRRNADSGDGWTVAYTRELGDGVSIVVESQRIDGDLAARARVGAPTGAVETLTQLAGRFRF